jgi:integrase
VDGRRFEVAWIKTYELQSGEKRYRVYWRDPSGKPHGKVFRRFADARNSKRDLERSLDEGLYRDPARGRITLEELWMEFIQAPPTPLAPSTRSLYEMLARIYLLPRFGQHRLNRIQPEDVRRFIADLAEQSVGEQSIRAAYRLLRRLLTFAVDDHRIGANPASKLHAPQPSPRETMFLTPQQVASVAHAVPPRYQALVLFLAYTGVRIGEASALRVKNLDLMHSRALIVEAAAEVRGERIVGPTKTRHNRAVRLPAFVRDGLAAHLSEFGTPTDPDSLVFQGARGGPIRQNAFRKAIFQPTARKVGINPPPRVHDLRHTAVALAISTGAHPKQIQEMVGHSSITVTLDVYGHLFESLHEDVADRLDGLYRQSGGRDAVVVPLRQ